ncbi:MAG TPA: MFS transporter [Vicinamibacterales bacterium]|nr:MFS transporter [Vicinamibacterales bacterium]
MTSATVLDVRQFIDERPVSRYQLLVAAMCGLIVFVDGFDAQAMGYVAPALTAALQIPRSVLGSVISSGLVGMMVGALVSGPLADRVGRKPVLVASALIFGVGSLLTATAQSVDALMMFRVLTGLGMGGAMPNAIALTSEYMPRRRRAGAVTTMICGFSLGAAVGGFVAATIIPRFGWQSVFVVGGVVPILIGVAALFLLPDSIRFLIVKGKQDARVRRYLSRIAPEAAIPAQLSPGVDESGAGDVFVVKELFTEGRAIATTLIWVIYFMNLLNLYFLNSWLPTIISDAGIPVDTAIRLTSLFQIGGIGGALVLGRVLDRFLSFWILAGCYVWAAACIFLIGQAGASVPLLAATIACAGLGIIGGQNASHALSSEFYPTRMRSTGVGWALGIGRIGSIVGPLLGGQLLAQGTAARQVFWAAAVPALIATVAAASVAMVRRGEPRR